MSDDKKKAPDAKPTLSDGDIKTERGLNRRTVLRGFGIGGLGLGSLAVSGCVSSGSGITDIDSGGNADPVGFGRGAPRAYATGITDRDFGNITDRVGYGRG